MLPVELHAIKYVPQGSPEKELLQMRLPQEYFDWEPYF
jgi:hypothetical protein